MSCLVPQTFWCERWRNWKVLTRHSQADLGQTFSGGGFVAELFHDTSISSAVTPAQSGNGDCVHAVFLPVSEGKPASYGLIGFKHRHLRRAREVSLLPAEVFDDARFFAWIPALNGDVLSRLCLQLDGQVDTCSEKLCIVTSRGRDPGRVFFQSSTSLQLAWKQTYNGLEEVISSVPFNWWMKSRKIIVLCIFTTRVQTEFFFFTRPMRWQKYPESLLKSK